MLLFFSTMGRANTGVGTQMLMESKSSEHFLAEVNYLPKNYKADLDLDLDLVSPRRTRGSITGHEGRDKVG